MSEKTTPSFPFTLPFGAEAIQKNFADAQARWSAFLEDAAKVDAQRLSHTRMMLDESARLAHETLNYWSQLGDDWRRISTEATRRAVDSLSSR